MIQKTSGGEPTFEVDSPEQYNQVPNDTYFKDNYLGVVLYKNLNGNVVNPWASGSSADIYEANLSQEESEDPTAVEFINTLGAVTLTRSVSGGYLLHCEGAFPDESKVYIINQTKSNVQVNWAWQDANTLAFDVYVNGSPADDGLSNTSVTIKVYP